MERRQLACTRVSYTRTNLICFEHDKDLTPLAALRAGMPALHRRAAFKYVFHLVTCHLSLVTFPLSLVTSSRGPFYSVAVDLHIESAAGDA